MKITPNCRIFAQTKRLGRVQSRICLAEMKHPRFHNVTDIPHST